MRGGKRQGAGRPPLDKPRAMRGFRLHPDLSADLDRMAELAGVSPATLIEGLIRDAAKLDGEPVTSIS